MKPIRWLFLAHRYLGIAVGLLMVMWCLSGIVMMYVRYPELPEAERLAHLQPLRLDGCCAVGEGLEPGLPVQQFAIEMLAGHPVMRIAQGHEAPRLIDLTDGHVVGRIDPEQAAAVALTYGARPGLAETVARDQWTVGSGFRKDRPLYRFAFDDAEGTRLYISSTDGRAVQITTVGQRFWNWLGAIPHWLYFTELRANAGLWSQVVIWTSLLGCFLTITGIYLGIRQWRRAPAARWSPYRGFMLWHHMPGLVFGLFVLSWVASGLVSMNPWGVLESDGAEAEQAKLRGRGPSITDIQALLASPLPAGTAVATAAFYDGRPAFIASRADGGRVRIDMSGNILPPPDIARAAAILGGQPPVLLQAGDAYYFDSRSEAASFPVYRIVAGDRRYYLDPLSGGIVKSVDGNGRWYRWLHEGLHRLDFTPALRSRPAWDAVMLLLMAGVTLVCGTGAYLGFRRLRRGFRAPPTKASPPANRARLSRP